MESYIFIALALVLTPQGFAESNNEYVKTCVQLFAPEIAKQGCNQFVQQFANLSLQRQCRNDTEEEYKCEHSRCMLTVLDVLEEDKIDEAKVERNMKNSELRFANQTEVMQSVRRRCLGGKFEKYWLEEPCAARKYQACVYSSLLVDSLEKDWKETDYCKKMSAISIQCKTVLEKE